MGYHSRYFLGKHQNSDKFALRLATSKFVDVLVFQNLKSRCFNIYRWQDDLIANGDYYSGWTPWLYWNTKVWSKYGLPSEKEILSNVGLPLVSFHKFFKNASDFQEWLGKEYQSLFIDLL